MSTLPVSVTDMIEIPSAPPLAAALIMAVMSYPLVLSAALTAIMSQASDSGFDTVKTSALVLT